MSVAVQYRMEYLKYDVFIYRTVDRMGKYFLQPDETEIFVPSNTYPEPSSLRPTFRLDEYDVKDLIEAFQRVGVQPKVLTKIEGQYEAQTKHLTDLQKILRKQGVME